MNFINNLLKKEREVPDPFFKADNYLISTIQCLKVVGMWPMVTKSSNIVYILLNIAYVLLLHAISIHIFVLGAFELKRTWDGDIDKIAPTVIDTSVYITGCVIILYFQVRTKGFMEIVDFVNKYFHIRSAVGMDFMTIEPSYRRAKKNSHVWVMLCILGCSHWTLYPIIAGSRTLPIAVTYPFDTETFPGYQLVYVLQAIGQMIVAIVFANFAIFYMCLVILTCGQYDILLCSLKNIRNTAMLNKGPSSEEISQMRKEYNSEEPDIDEYYCGNVIKEDLDVILTGNGHFPVTHKPLAKETSSLNDTVTNYKKYIENFDLRTIKSYVNHGTRSAEEEMKNLDNYLMEYNEELTQALAACVRHHQMILQFCRMIENLISPLMFAKVFEITFLLCFTAYNASTVLLKADVKLLNLLEYLLLIAGELFLFCYYGQLLTLQSQMIGAALMRSPWHLCGGPFRRGIRILIEASSKPVVLTGGKIYKMNLWQFRSLISASFSYFTVLSNIQNK